MFIVSVLFPAPATGFTLNLAAAPDGRPLTLKVTLPVKPPEGVTVAV